MTGSLKAAWRPEDIWGDVGGPQTPWAGQYSEGHRVEAGRGASPRPRAWECPGRLRACWRLVKGPLTVTDGGPVRLRQLGKMECQCGAINILAADWPRNVNGGVEQAGENVQFRQDGFFRVLKTCSSRHKDFKLSNKGTRGLTTCSAQGKSKGL